MAKATPAEPTTDVEHHTKAELYAYRMAYHAHAAQGWLAAGIPVVKSLKHSDGQPCFDGSWFIVVATLPSGQVSNHYRNEHWRVFDVPEVDVPPAYDGHTPEIALERLLDALPVRDDGLLSCGHVPLPGGDTDDACAECHPSGDDADPRRAWIAEYDAAFQFRDWETVKRMQDENPEWLAD